MKRLLPLLFLLFPLSVIAAWSSGNDHDRIPSEHTDSLVFNLATDNTEFPSSHVLQTALDGYKLLLDNQSINRPEVITIIDFSLPSDKERLWVLDIINKKVLYCCLVSHGRNSGDLKAESFSNIPGSNASSPGFYSTGETYHGKHGLSLTLNGLEPDINDKARTRSIVMHGADYVSSDFIRRHGRLGRSHGCPAVPAGQSNEIINTIKEGSCLFIYAPVADYTSNSHIINEITSIKKSEPLLLPVSDLKPPVLFHLSDRYLSGIVSDPSHQSMP
ncbi:MAG TPA: hypothetical protein DDY34_10385 [Bacteroidales bacterium]|nr:hypothetical protein [Bacteroidales bacterium]HBH84199.1 hypothetical protein [Bacteroidales bacterium]HBQ83725.1 hypothetical protein [Bacteroidales bacterium]HCU20206.1 hypothetical protein [Bacteroidales bacterium]